MTGLSNRFRPRHIFFFFLSLVAILFALAIPPFQKPDEQLHFWKTMAVAEGRWKCRNAASVPPYTLVSAVRKFPDAMHYRDIVMRADAKFPVNLYKMTYPFRGDTTRMEGFEPCVLPTVGYIPFVLAAWVSYPFDNLLVTFVALRLVAAFLFVTATWISVRIASVRFRSLVYLFAATPMVIHQATAVSYDAPLLWGLLICFAWFTSLMAAKRVSVKTWIGFTAVVLITSLVKQGHFFLYTLPIVVALRNISLKSVRSRIAALVFGIGTVAAGAYGIPAFVRQNLFRAQIQVYARDPLYFLRQLYATIGENSEYYLRGMVGAFGWLDTALPPILLAAYWITLGIVLVKTVRFDRVPTRWGVPIILFVLCLVNITAIFFHFAYVSETPPAYAVISGMQGRYMLPLLPFLLYAFSLFISVIGRKNTILLLVTAGGGIALIWTGSILYERYFDYRATFKNPRYFETQLFDTPTIDLTTLRPYTIGASTTFRIEPLYEGHKIGGFQFIMGNELDVTTPYQYRVSDRDCVRMVREGFLDKLKNRALSFLKGPTDVVYTQTFPITRVEGNTYCITLWPVMQDDSRTYLSLLGNEKSPLIEFLYIQQ